MNPLPPLPPIITLDPPRLSAREKYGSLFYLGVAGLVFVSLLLTWFCFQAWSLRNIWIDVYVLHDASRPEAERVAAAHRLSVDRRVNDRQAFDIALRKAIPVAARLMLADRVRGDLAAEDPSGYTVMLEHGTVWPIWLRVELARPLAYAAVAGTSLPMRSLESLAADPEPAIALWANAAIALERGANRTEAIDRIKALANHKSDRGELAGLLLEAVNSADLNQKINRLDAATKRTRTIALSMIEPTEQRSPVRSKTSIESKQAEPRDDPSKSPKQNQ
jgi:hypothetical protein